MIAKKIFLIFPALFFLSSILIPVNAKPESIYSQDFVESLDTFVFSKSFANPSTIYYIDSPIGDNCIQVYNNTPQTSYISGINTEVKVFPNGYKVVGCYIKICSGSVLGTQCIFKVADNSSNHAMWISIFYSYDHSRWEMSGGVYGSGGGSNMVLTSVNLDVWYWVEMEYVNPNEQSFYVNGVGKGGFSGYGVNMGNDCTIFIVDHLEGTIIGKARYDYIRCTDYLEYPPTAIVKLSIYAYNIETNQNLTISIPFSINSTFYDTPFVGYKNFGYYALAPRMHWNNKSHVFDFVNWSDYNGAERTIYLNSPKTYIMQYQVSEKWDPGGWVDFFIGVAGLFLIFGSWISLKVFWDDEEYAKALGTWIVMLILGIGLTTVLLGG